MLYQVLERMIKRGQTEGLREKIDVFFAAGRLRENEYLSLLGLLGG